VSAALDVNVLVYASNRSAPEQERAQALITELVRGPELLFLFWPVIMGYLRVATSPTVVPVPRSAIEIMDNVGAILSRPHVRTPGEADGFWEIYRSTGGDQARGKLVTDAHIAALMRQHGVRVIYTRDRDFRRFDGIEPVDPFD